MPANWTWTLFVGSCLREALSWDSFTPPGQVVPVLRWGLTRQKTKWVCDPVPGPLRKGVPTLAPGVPTPGGLFNASLYCPALSQACAWRTTGDGQAPLPGAKSGIWLLCVLALPFDLRRLAGRPLSFLTCRDQPPWSVGWGAGAGVRWLLGEGQVGFWSLLQQGQFLDLWGSRRLEGTAGTRAQAARPRIEKMNEWQWPPAPVALATVWACPS